MNNDIITRRARLLAELEQAQEHPPGPVRDAVVEALKDRLKALERIKKTEAA